MTGSRQGNECDPCNAATRWWRELRWAWRCFRRYNREVYRTISPHPAPPKTVERLRRRVIEGKWD